MAEPARLRDGVGPASQLLRGAGMVVPSASRRRALAFTAAAMNLAAGGTALAAGGMSLAKSVVLCVSLGAVGGGLASLGVSSAISSWGGAGAPATVATPRPAAPPAPRVVASAAGERSEPRMAPEPSAAPLALPPPSVKPPSLAVGAPPSASRGNVARRSLFDEQREIEEARAAIARGDFTRGLGMLEGYERGFPQGQFHPEALALRVEAKSRRGDLAGARALADEFARRYPQHPLLGRVRASVDSR